MSQKQQNYVYYYVVSELKRKLRFRRELGGLWSGFLSGRKGQIKETRETRSMITPKLDWMTR